MAHVSQIDESKKALIWPLLTRLIPYWLTVATGIWGIAIAYAWNSDKAWDFIQTQIVDPVSVSRGFEHRSVPHLCF